MRADRNVEDLLRELAPRVLGTLTRRYGQFDACEDAVQEALLAAAQQWVVPDGVPASPRSWLLTVASRRLVDEWRSESARRRREETAAALEVVDGEPVGDDDTLTLLFWCCHPELSAPSQLALTLRAVGGLTTAQIASAFLVPEPTMGQRISRAKQRIAAATPAPAASASSTTPARSVAAVPAEGATSSAAPAPCGECGGVVDPDGYCETCGAKAPRARDHLVEQPQAWVAAVSDRGVRHHRNEDAMAVAAEEAPGSRAVLVVCDGVSSSEDSDVASLAAARAARAVLVGSRAQGMATDSGLTAVITARLEAAADAASRAVAAATSPDHGESPPSCTFVAVVVERDRIVAGVVGDSRAYWLPDAGEPRMLTEDDSWAAEQIAAGVPRAVAESGPQSHAITRWLGVDAPDHTPRVTSMVVGAPGWLLVCSDGLWNYCSPAADLAALLRRTAEATAGEPLTTASALVDWANAQGGHDNITVALARLGTPVPSGSAANTTEED